MLLYAVPSAQSAAQKSNTRADTPNPRLLDLLTDPNLDLAPRFLDDEELLAYAELLQAA